jgi:hypothetical protein
MIIQIDIGEYDDRDYRWMEVPNHTVDVIQSYLKRKSYLISISESPRYVRGKEIKPLRFFNRFLSPEYTQEKIEQMWIAHERTMSFLKSHNVMASGSIDLGSKEDYIENMVKRRRENIASNKRVNAIISLLKEQK